MGSGRGIRGWRRRWCCEGVGGVEAEPHHEQTAILTTPLSMSWSHTQHKLRYTVLPIDVRRRSAYAIFDPGRPSQSSNYLTFLNIQTKTYTTIVEAHLTR